MSSGPGSEWKNHLVLLSEALFQGPHGQGLTHIPQRGKEKAVGVEARWESNR